MLYLSRATILSHPSFPHVYTINIIFKYDSYHLPFLVLIALLVAATKIHFKEQQADKAGRLTQHLGLPAL
jgi:hypothetical protein